ncbi:MAG: hypothetical protein AAGE59_37360, partial [Cyanobacteria bacterium P01_F01_bin.86]
TVSIFFRLPESGKGPLPSVGCQLVWLYRGGEAIALFLGVMARTADKLECSQNWAASGSRLL